MRRFVVAFTIVVLTGIAALVLAWDEFTTFLATPTAETGAEKVIVIPLGASHVAVVDLLAKEGLVSNAAWLKLYVDHFGRALAVHPGEYALAPTMSPVEIFRRIGSGKVLTYTFSIPPGSEAGEIAALISAKKLGDEAELMKLIFDAQLAKSLGVPADSLEGFLFPDVYDLPRGLAARAVLQTFVQRYQKTVTKEMLKDAAAIGLQERELITIASLIEKSGVPVSERRLYSALIRNRLKEQMPLESPASVDYGLHRLGVSAQTATDVEKDHPWNTMLHEGLPKTPIASPSLAAIAAAVEPAPSRALWMVERPDGTHLFCEDRECYQTANRQWGTPRAEHRGRKRP